MRLANDTIDLLCAAFLLRARQDGRSPLLFLRRDADFASMFKEGVGVSLTAEEAEIVLARLIEVGLFARVEDRFTKGFVHVVGSPAGVLERLASNETSSFYFADRLGREWIEAALASEAFLGELSDPALELVSSVAPAADRLVTLDHNSEGLVETVRKLEFADEAVRGSNSLGEDARSWIRLHLEAGLKLLSGRKIVLSAIGALLIKPLLEAYNSVAEEPARQLILAAVEAAKEFFGL